MVPENSTLDDLDQASKPRPRDYVALLIRYKWLLLFLTTLMVLLTYLSFAMRAPEYEARVTLDLDRQAALPATSPGANSLDEFVDTQAQLLQSEAVIRPVAKKYEVGSRDLTVERLGRTSLVQLRYRSPEAKLAGDVAGAIAASYLDMQERNRYNAWVAASALSETQIADAKSRMEQSEEELLQAQTGGATEGAISRLQESYVRAMADRASRKAAYEAVKNGSLAALLATGGAEPLRRLIERKTEAVRKFNDLKQIFGENHPDYKRAQAEIEEIDDDLDDARQSAVEKAQAQMKEADSREQILRQEVQRSGLRPGGSLPPAQYEALKQKAEAERSLYLALVRKLSEAQIDARLRNSQVRIVDPVSVRPVRRQLLRNSLLALLSALPLTLFVLAFGGVEKRLRTAADLKPLGAPVLAVLPAIRAWKESWFGNGQPHLIAAAVSGVKEMAYREAIDRLRDSVSSRVVAVVSALPGEGRSSLAANLAPACAEAGKRVLLIDGDLRRPSLHRLFLPAPPPAGLPQVLRGEAKWRDAVQETPGARLHLLAGGAPEKVGTEFEETVLPAFLSDAALEFDLVLMDTPSFLQNPEAVDFVKNADEVLVVALAGKTGEEPYLKLLGYLKRLNVRVLGVVLNGV